MAQLNSFDITSTVDLQEVDNGINQARKEITQRYDFKGARADIDFDRAEHTITITADDNFKLEAIWEILQTRLVRRNVPVKNLTLGDIQPVSGSGVRREISTAAGHPFRRVPRDCEVP